MVVVGLESVLKYSEKEKAVSILCNRHWTNSSNLEIAAEP